MRQKRATAPPPSQYKYLGYTDTEGQWVAPHIQCEEAGDHQVTPSVWPPPRTAMMTSDPSLSIQCVLCGCWLIVYEGHATGAMAGVEVVIPEIRKAKQPA